LDAISAALSVVLRVLRESARSTALVAQGGVFTQGPGEKPAQMLRLTLSREYACVPEVSANKYALNIRFLVPDGVQKKPGLRPGRVLRPCLLQPVTTPKPGRMVSCPACGKPASFSPSNRFRPFCTDRCRTTDLGEWASEGYRIPVKEADGGDETGRNPPE